MCYKQYWFSVNFKDGGGTEEVQVSSSEAAKCCLSDMMCLKLAKLGVEVMLFHNINIC